MLQLPLFAPTSTWKAPKMSDLPSWKGARRVAIDCETRDPNLKKLGPGVRRPDSYVVGMSFAIEDGEAFYLPFRHEGGGNLPEEQVLGYLREQGGDFKGDIVGANLQYDLDYLAQEGVTFNPRFFRDVQIAEPLLDELQRSYSLNAIAQRYAIPGKDQDLLEQAAQAYGVSPKGDLWQLPAEYVGPYAEQDVRLPLRLLDKQERRIDEEGLWEIYDLESSLLPVLVKMRRRGVQIDFNRLEYIEQWSAAEEATALAEVKRLTGVSIEVGDVWRAEPLARVLEEIGIKVPATPKTGRPSVTAALLDSIEHEAAGLLRRARKINKVRTTFANSVRQHQVNGRIHCTFNQLRQTKEDGAESGGRFGRLSSSDPNLQQQPGKRDPEIGLLWRKVYVPDEGAQWACLDFSQQEPRWLVHYAEKQNCIRAHAAAERYREDRTTDNHQMMADLTGLPRQQAKQIFLGLCYGMGGGKLCAQLGLPTESIYSSRLDKQIDIAGPEGAAILDRFDQEVPFVRELTKMCAEVAKERGWIRTVLGRKCRFPKGEGGAFDWTHKAVNRLIQGSSADQTKQVMVNADKEGYPIQLQVHDELDLSVPDKEYAQGLAEIMMNSVECNVPHQVDVEIGPNWGELSTS